MTLLETIVNLAVGGTLVLAGLYHNSVGPGMSRWLDRVHPSLSAESKATGRLGWDGVGYLFISVGISFILLGGALPLGYYLLWSLSFAAWGGIALYYYAKAGVSPFHFPTLLFWVLAGVIGTYYAYSSLA